jgi:hypothetical protein
MFTSIRSTTFTSCWYVVKPDQIDILAFTVLCDLQQIQNAEEPRLSGQLRRDIGKPDRNNRLDFDLSVGVHPVASADLHMRALPYTNTARDISPANSFA